MNNRFIGRIVVLGSSAASAGAFAAAPDFTTLTGAVDFTTVGGAILAIAALMMVPKVVKWGAARVLAMVR